jgi:4-alpha-glucanotransferase
MELIRASGILLHPTSFPGPHGIGDLGQAGYDFIDFLVQSKQSLWQVLPLGPTGYGDSPYASFSSFAGNPLLISLDRLLEDGYLSKADLGDLPTFPADKVDYGWVIDWKMPLLEKAARRFLGENKPERQVEFADFCQAQGYWLDDFALFMAVKAFFDQQAKAANIFGAMWSNYWTKDIALREPTALRHWQAEEAEAIAIQKVLQFFFFSQWRAVRRYANEAGIQIIGDIPIFVAPDSADVWANRELFLLDEEGQPTVVAGVPPDYFSPTGQLWGNPLYDWPAMAAQGYDWWIKRIQHTLNLVDIVRIDHFRGFEAYWEIPAEEKTAVEGRWVPGPGSSFFTAITAALGELPIIAEDLGVITEAVVAIRDQFQFPGMKVLQFAFDLDEAGGRGAINPFLPHNFQSSHCLVYTGTHDNDTTLGWYTQRTEAENDLIRRYLARDDQDIVWHFIRLALASNADWAIIPLQDVLELGSEARMNAPSTSEGNWAWRYQATDLIDSARSRLRDMVTLYGRDPQVWLAAQRKAADDEADDAND